MFILYLVLITSNIFSLGAIEVRSILIASFIEGCHKSENTIFNFDAEKFLKLFYILNTQSLINVKNESNWVFLDLCHSLFLN